MTSKRRSKRFYMARRIGSALVPFYAYNESDGKYLNVLREQIPLKKSLVALSHIGGGIVASGCIILSAKLIDLFSDHEDLLLYSAFTSGVLTFVAMFLFMVMTPPRADKMLSQYYNNKYKVGTRVTEDEDLSPNPEWARQHAPRLPSALKVLMLSMCGLVSMLLYFILFVLAIGTWLVDGDSVYSIVFTLLQGTLMGLAGGIGMSFLFFWAWYLFVVRHRLRTQERLIISLGERGEAPGQAGKA